jgi:myo-inositol-1(or 4)-monophosphatase
MSQFQSFLGATIRTAADIANSHFGKTTSTTKAGDNNQVLTEADLAIGKHIIAQIEAEYPDHNIIDEEVGVIDKGSQYTWVIDPIDGTSNFASGVPTYGVMLGLIEKDVPIAGAIALPAFNQVYIAGKGEGTHLDGKKITVTREENLLSTLVAYSMDGHQEKPETTRDECRIFAEIVLGIRNIRSSGSCFDWMMVAKGAFGGGLNRTSKIWDNVAVQIIIEEAGGVYTDFFGEPMDYSNALQRADENFTACCASPALHRQLQKIIHAYELKGL